MAFHVPEKFRIETGKFKSDETYGNNGAFILPLPNDSDLIVIASDKMGWEHVSLSHANRLPTWRELAEIKNFFWDEEDCVVQYLVPKSQHKNIHEFCLHLWRPVDGKFPMPPKEMV